MAVIGIISCAVFELEFAYLLSMDPDVGRVTVIENSQSARMIESLEARGVKDIARIPHIRSFRPEPSDRLEVIVRIMDMSLHNQKNNLNRSVISAIHEMNPHVDAVFLGYGLCGGTFRHVQELSGDGVRVFIPMENEHPVDDCIGLLIGGRDCYYNEQKKVPGTFFMTPGWSSHWKMILNKPPDDIANDHVKRLFNCFKRCLLISTPAIDEDKLKRNGEAFARMFELYTEERKGTMSLLIETWASAKDYVSSKD